MQLSIMDRAGAKSVQPWIRLVEHPACLRTGKK